MEAKWVRGSKLSGDPSKCYAEIERIKKKNGGSVKAIDLVEAAKPRNNPMHKDIYRLSDNDAVLQHRLDVARKMLRSVEVVYEEAPDKPVKAYEVITEPPKMDMPERKVYKSTKEILADQDMRDELLGRAIRDAIAYKRRYAILQELSQVFMAIDDFLVHNKSV